MAASNSAKKIDSKKTSSGSRKTRAAGSGSSARKTAGGRSSGGSRNRRPAPKKDSKTVIAKKKSFLKSEVGAVGAVAAAFILLLANLHLLGRLGGWILAFEKGLFGQASFLLCVAVVAGAAISYLERGKYMRPYKIGAVLAALIFVSAVLHLMFGGKAGFAESARPGLADLYRMGSAGEPGGGMIGGGIANLLHGLIGQAGAYLVLIALLVICAVILTEKSFAGFLQQSTYKTADVMRQGAGRTVEAARNGRDRYLRYHQEQKIRRNARREMDRLRRLEENFEDLSGGPSLERVTLDPEGLPGAESGIYAAYGREIIGDNAASAARQDQTGFFRQETGNIFRTQSERSVRQSGDSGPSSAGNPTVRYYGEESPRRDVFTPKANPSRTAVHVKQIDYDLDEVPFEENTEETYKSYAHMLEQQEISLYSARQAGMAVGVRGAEAAQWDAAGWNAAEPVPESFDAFKPAEPSYEIRMSGFDDKEGGRPDSESYINDGFDADGLVQENEINSELMAEGIRDLWTGKEEIREQPYGTVPLAEEVQTAGEMQPAGETQSAGTAPKGTDGTYEPEPEGEDPGGACAEEPYISSSGKEMEAPDSFEAARILALKRGDAGAREDNLPRATGNALRTDEKAPASDRTPPAAASALQNAANPAAPGHPGAGAAQNAKAANQTPAAAGAEASPQPVPKPLPKPKPYVFPPIGLLEKGKRMGSDSREEAISNARKLEKVLRDFGVGVHVTDVTRGPRVSRYEMTPETGVKVSRISALENDIKLALAAREIRIEAPIPGKSAVGIEVPNEESQTVKFRDILESEEFRSAKSRLSWGVGLDIQGKPVVGNIAKMPHLLVAGTTGSGKSVGINSLIMSILYRATPEEVRMILIDPKVVELSVYNGIPHLLTDVVTKPERAVSALNWAVAEMNNRYKLFQTSGTRNIGGYNEKVEEVNRELDKREAAGEVITENHPRKLPYILIVIDELAELMMHSKKDIESSIVSLTQLARAAGIHLVVATQRPSVDVITGLIKSNIPSRIAYRLPSQTDSRTILDSGGAEALLGNGDMLYKPGDKNSPERIQGAFLSDNEVEAVVSFLRKHNQQNNDEEVEAAISQAASAGGGTAAPGSNDSTKPDGDEYLLDAGRLIITSGKASIGALQRKFKIGFNRAARIMDSLHEMGVVSDGEGTKERQILMSMEEFENTLGG